MTKLKNRRSILSALALLLGIGFLLGSALGQSKQSTDKPLKQQLTDAQVKQLMLLMDTDKTGKISKTEWMNFMSAEFDRLDKDKTGELDAKELEVSRVQVSPFAVVGK